MGIMHALTGLVIATPIIAGCAWLAGRWQR